jgi:hypothetical protein
MLSGIRSPVNCATNSTSTSASGRAFPGGSTAFTKRCTRPFGRSPCSPVSRRGRTPATIMRAGGGRVGQDIAHHQALQPVQQFNAQAVPRHILTPNQQGANPAGGDFLRDPANRAPNSGPAMPVQRASLAVGIAVGAHQNRSGSPPAARRRSTPPQRSAIRLTATTPRWSAGRRPPPPPIPARPAQGFSAGGHRSAQAIGSIAFGSAPLDLGATGLPGRSSGSSIARSRTSKRELTASFLTRGHTGKPVLPVSQS